MKFLTQLRYIFLKTRSWKVIFKKIKLDFKTEFNQILNTVTLLFLTARSWKVIFKKIKLIVVS